MADDDQLSKVDRRAYWQFLRRVYGMSADEAWCYINELARRPQSKQSAQHYSDKGHPCRAATISAE